MATKRNILCGYASASGLPEGAGEPLRLQLWGSERNVTLSLHDISKHMLQNVPPRFVDLLEIATYVYCADQAITRGGNDVDMFGHNWRRRFFFRIAVREPDFWMQSTVLKTLSETLGFLSDDEYTFDFVPLDNGPPLQRYLEFSDGISLGDIKEVLLFSGGLDSLAGAVKESVVNRRKVILVTHVSTTKLQKRLETLNDLLKQKATPIVPIHIPVTIQKKDSCPTREYTQRSRSFLYAALTITVAEMVGLSRVAYCENGVTSLNLPLSAQVVGAKATRTTHPRVLSGFSTLASLVSQREFEVENKFISKTKTDIVNLLKDADCSELVGLSTSCVHTRAMTLLHTHCGACSQCIDRRFAVLAADVQESDPADSYKVDLLVGERDEGEPRTLLAAYAETANEISKMTNLVQFLSRYGEVSRVVKHMEGTPDTVALRVFELLQRHAKQVTGVIDRAIENHASEIRERVLPPSCLLRLVCDASDSSPSPALVSSGEIHRHRVSEVCAKNIFKQAGHGWVARYLGGEKNILFPTVGVAYLHILLSNPGRDFDVVDLVFEVAKEPNTYALRDVGPASDDTALVAYRARLENLAMELSEADSNNDYYRQGKIRELMEWLEDTLRKDTALGGKARKLGDDRDRCRKRFQIAVKRAVDEIRKYDSKLADYLASPTVQCGWNPVYNPPAPIKWET